ncbi:(Fe-S)-binding protein [Mycobacterium sp.]|uniref:(Fe-S)-binding protein n=1 Tax=Mycobacterium sp. TaxID=1785 RepID=UPI0012863BAC|nr:(Fe-S)-binding protein [Mycobacterium sp.]KAA8962580.1 MAG: (Fe-S)-binding protein [Mycobacterium sp.]
MQTQMLIRLVVGLGITLIVGLFALRRISWLARLVASGQPASGRADHVGRRIWAELSEVFGQRRLLKWSIPGMAHFFTMWGFFILLSVYIEAYGLLFQPNFHIPIIGRWDGLGFLQDFFATAVFCGIVTFAIIRTVRNPRELGRASRFYGSHTGGAWLILFMIFNVIWTYALVRGSAVNNGTLPYGKAAFLSQFFAAILRPLGPTGNEILETVALLLHIGVMLAFLIIVLHSKHLHIFLAPINVVFKRLPDALGPLQPIEYDGKQIDFDNPPEDAVFGRGKIEDFTWKGMLDFATCTECGRCQSQCPAWNTGKPLSPKLVIMDLRDHWMAKAPYLLGQREISDGGPGDSGHGAGHHVPESGFGRVTGSGPEQASRPLVGTAEQGGVIDPDVLWSCVTCGACVEQCPVDIEHVDHIVDMRRYQVMMESEFPSELSGLFKNLEAKGNPWGQNAGDRTNWIDEVDFDVPVYGQDVDSFDGYEYLFWVGCAGAYDDRAKKTTKAVAELLATAGVKYLVLGAGESCTGDSARRAGNEFLFQQLAQQAVETLDGVFEGVETVDRKIVVTCPHCFNTLGREYRQLGANYTVLHHTQLLNRLVRDQKLVPVTPVGSGPSITYHDPCYLGRHNKEYMAPRELIGASGATLTEMARHAERSFCCGAGGARMWMEEHIGKRINHERVDEALATGATTVATACPFCRVMVTDGVNDRAEAAGRDDVDVRDVANLLLESIDRSKVTLPAKGTAAQQAAKSAPAAPAAPVEETVETATVSETVAPAPEKTAKAVTGLGIAAGAKRPGAKKTTPPPAAPQAESKTQPAQDEPPAAPAAPVKGLGIAAGAKRPGAKKTTPPPAAPPTESKTQPAQDEPPAAPAAPVKGLGIARGARPPGKR